MAAGSRASRLRWRLPCTLLWLWAGNAAAAPTPASFQAHCEQAAGAHASVLSLSEPRWLVNNALSTTELTAMKGQGGMVLGLTRAESRIGIALKGRLLLETRSRQECIAPQVTVNLSYLPIVIYISSAFAPGSCAYQEILTHEMRHLKAYQAHLPKVEAAVREALDRRFAARPVYAPEGQARSMLEQEMDGHWMAFIKQAMAQVEPAQAAIDTPGEYARLGKVCAGEVQFLNGRTR